QAILINICSLPIVKCYHESILHGTLTSIVSNEVKLLVAIWTHTRKKVTDDDDTFSMELYPSCHHSTSYIFLKTIAFDHVHPQALSCAWKPQVVVDAKSNA